jgi:hypothetical protein
MTRSTLPGRAEFRRFGFKAEICVATWGSREHEAKRRQVQGIEPLIASALNVEHNMLGVNLDKNEVTVGECDHDRRPRQPSRVHWTESVLGVPAWLGIRRKAHRGSRRRLTDSRNGSWDEKSSRQVQNQAPSLLATDLFLISSRRFRTERMPAGGRVVWSVVGQRPWVEATASRVTASRPCARRARH